jgi:hypothetical protein
VEGVEGLCVCVCERVKRWAKDPEIARNRESALGRSTSLRVGAIVWGVQHKHTIQCTDDRDHRMEHGRGGAK